MVLFRLVKPSKASARELIAVSFLSSSCSFLKFKSGKGVASSAGIFFALIPIPALISLVLFIIILKASKYVSLGSITAALALPATAYFFSYQSELIGFTILVALFVIITHKSNIKRLLNGTENRFNTKKKKI